VALSFTACKLLTQGFNGTWDQLTEYLAGLKA
jgi:hypothetical protein